MAHNINLKEPNYETVMCNFEEIEPIFSWCFNAIGKVSPRTVWCIRWFVWSILISLLSNACELAWINCFPIARRGGARFSFSVQSLPTYTCKQGFCRSVFHLDTVYKDTFLALVVRLDNTFGTIPYSLVQYTV